jgi:hypothetical protein
MKWYNKVLYWIKVIWIIWPHIKQAYKPILAIVAILKEEANSPYARGDVKRVNVTRILTKKIANLDENGATEAINATVDALKKLGGL